MDQAYYANQRNPELQRCTYPLHIVVLTRQAAEARRSASAVIREALDAYRGQIEAEIKLLKG